MDNPCVLLDGLVEGRSGLRHYFSDPELHAALVAGMSQLLVGEVVCAWPDGTLRKVIATSITNGIASILWNERHPMIEGQGCVVGMQDAVPVEWLYIPVISKSTSHQ